MAEVEDSPRLLLDEHQAVHSQSPHHPVVRPTYVRIAMPAYNEQDSLPLLIPRIVQCMEETPWQYEILVVDDGSKDNTVQVVEELAKRYPVKLVKHEVNRGLGAAITTAITAGVEGLYDDDIVITMDADNTHPPQLISRMVPMIREGRDIVIASRFVPGSQVIGLSRFRETLSVGASWMMRLCFGVRGCKDYTCGYRAYRAGVLRAAHNKYNGKIVQETGFASMAELLLRIAKMGVVIGEVPMLLRYDMKEGASKMRIGRTIVRTFAMVIRHRLGK
jgi:dolichol-phosphate mannosyltransferase